MLDDRIPSLAARVERIEKRDVPPPCDLCGEDRPTRNPHARGWPEAHVCRECYDRDPDEKADWDDLSGATLDERIERNERRWAQLRADMNRLNREVRQMQFETSVMLGAMQKEAAE